LVSSLKNQLRRLDDFFASLSVRSSDVNFFAKCFFETNVNGLSFVSARLPEWVDHGMRCAPGGTKFSVGGIIEYLSSICVWLLQATGFSQSQPRLGHLHQQVFLLRAFRVLREAQTRPRIILVTLGFFDRHRGIPNPRLNSTLGH
jgi:hypothetical protein